MPHRQPPRAPPSPAVHNVNTTQRESGAPSQTPKLPHDRDESVDMTHGVPSEAMKQAHADLEHGLQDTDARGESGRPLNQETNAPQPESPAK